MSITIEEVDRKVEDLKLVVKSDRKASDDQLQDLRQQRSSDFMGAYFRDIGESLDKYNQEITKLKSSMSSIESTAMTARLTELRKESGITLKEIAEHLGYSTENLSGISKLMQGATKDENKRKMAYDYLMSKTEG